VYKRKPRVGNVRTQNIRNYEKVLGGITAQATTVNEGLYGSKGSRYQNAQPITFKVKGVRYFVHTDGTLDFKVPRYLQEQWHTEYGYSNYNSRYRKTTPGIRYDRHGRVIKIGKSHIYYNRYGQVTKIAQFQIGYRHDKVKSIGDLYVRYDRYGKLLALEGYLAPYRNECPICNAYGCSVGYFNLADYQYVAYNNAHHWNGNNHGDSYVYSHRNRSRSRGR